MIKRVYNALFAFSVVSTRIPEGTFLAKLNNAAAAINKPPTPIYKTMTLLKLKLAI